MQCYFDEKPLDLMSLYSGDIKTSFTIEPTRPKRHQVKNACVNCQKVCKKCDDGRPCQRCIKYNITDTCRNSARKERRKGIKRGSYGRNNKRIQRYAHDSNKKPGNSLAMPLFTNNHEITNTQTITVIPDSHAMKNVTPPTSSFAMGEAFNTLQNEIIWPTSFLYDFPLLEQIQLPMESKFSNDMNLLTVRNIQANAIDTILQPQIDCLLSTTSQLEKSNHNISNVGLQLYGNHVLQSRNLL
ncbi:uncharacterized protein B0P05DRAFT_538984 [Gilbertella persicaria]|uniref:uncharacterized protein n=1 Tax=Gilbertella persicaria TaxID=101096 RepID=UPI00221FADEE|nr:uncharacterized protein B0P05DRAFT_538984 [Gilbertella persicaria]KAI8082005.1 hypothetical protein B0P05DRAFT_538984 [Gilbertella persicaria]